MQVIPAFPLYTTCERMSLAKKKKAQALQRWALDEEITPVSTPASKPGALFVPYFTIKGGFTQ